MPIGGAPLEEVELGERARLQAAQVLEQTLSAQWVVTLEALGADAADGWTIVVDRLRLVRTGPERPAANGRPQPVAAAAP